MKNKLLALILGAAMAFGGLFAFSACADGNGENGGSGSQGGGGGQGGSGSDKTTVDNFDEWYAAIMDTIHSDNYSYELIVANGSQQQQPITVKRQGANVGASVTDIYMLYGLVGEHTFRYYDNFDESWQCTEYSDSETSEKGTYYARLQFELGCFALRDEGLCSAFGDALMYSGTDFYIEDEDDLKAIAAERYDDVVYDATEGTYTVEYVSQISGADIYTYTFKFLNGKVSSVVAKNGEHVRTYRNFNYGNASITIPDEVLAIMPSD